jgi:DNA polymerase-3 subunit gamma/tau
VPDAPATGLVDAPDDQGERLVAQAARFGKAELVRAADCVAAGLTEMRGATTPRLLLELICARVLLPGADHATDGLAARMDRLERRIGVAGAVSSSGAEGHDLGHAPAGPTTPPAPPAAEPVETSAQRPPMVEPVETQPPGLQRRPVGRCSASWTRRSTSAG